MKIYKFHFTEKESDITIISDSKQAILDAKKDVQEKPNEPVPMHIRNAPTKLMKDLGYHKGYKYDHNFENKFSGQNFFPESMGKPTYYEPGEYGFEREVKKRMDWWKKLKE